MDSSYARPWECTGGGIGCMAELLIWPWDYRSFARGKWAKEIGCDRPGWSRRQRRQNGGRGLF